MDKPSFTIPVADIFIFLAIVSFAFFGSRRGALRTLSSILRVYFSFIITAISYEELAQWAYGRSETISLPAAQMLCFTVIFVVSLIMMWAIAVVVRRVSNSAETSGSFNKTVGAILGLLEGILILSILIMIVNLYPVPPEARAEREKSFSYKTVRHIAPAIKDYTISPFLRIKKLAEGSKTEDKSEDE